MNFIIAIIIVVSVAVFAFIGYCIWSDGKLAETTIVNDVKSQAKKVETEVEKKL